MSALDMKSLLAHGLACLLIFAGTACICAQDNPFGESNNPFSTAPTNQPPADQANQADQADQADQTPAELLSMPKINESLPESSQLIIRAVIESNPSTPIELAKAARTLMDIEAYDHARFFLNQLVGFRPDDKAMFELESTMGSNFLMRLATDDHMQPLGRSFADTAVAASKRAAYNPQRIEQLISTLTDENILVRSEAFRALRRLGPAAAAKLINVFADPAREKEFPFIRGALNSFGDEAIEPLIGASRANQLQVQVEALRALHYYKSSAARDAMLRAYLLPKFPESVRRSALDTMMTRYGDVADPAAGEHQLFQHAEDYLMGRRTLPGANSDLFTIWRWDPEKKQLEPIVVTKITAERIAAAELASDLYEIQPDSLANRRLYLITLLEAAKRQAGPSREIDFRTITSRIPQLEHTEMSAVLDQALELDLVPAAIAACEVLERIGTSDTLATTDHRPSPLVRGMLYGNRHLQFAAFKAIDGIDPRAPFAGSSYMSALAAYLSASQGMGGALVGNDRIAVAQSDAAILRQCGLNGQAAGTSRAFFKTAVKNPDFEVLFIGDTMTRPDYLELVQQLRNDWRTRKTPIGVLVRNESVARRANRVLENDSALLVLPVVTNAAQMASHVSRLRQLTKPWPVSDADRRLHAYAAARWLAKVSSDRESFKFWNLGQYQNELANLMYVKGFATFASQILSALGTPLAQRTLVNFASQNTLPLEDRRIAANAFAQSVKRAGVMLVSDEIKLQYDRYNASENEPKSTQEILATILDAIESRQDQVSSKTN